VEFFKHLLKTVDSTGLIRGGGSLGIDKLGNILVTAGRTVMSCGTSRNAGGSYVQVQSLFSPPIGHNLVTNDRFRLSSEGGVAIVGNQLAVADGRLLFWDNPSSLANGKPADGYLRTEASDALKSATDFPSKNVFGYVKGTPDKLSGNRR
jgi:hypothetical protein